MRIKIVILSDLCCSSQQDGAAITATPPHVDIPVPSQDWSGPEEKVAALRFDRTAGGRREEKARAQPEYLRFMT